MNGATARATSPARSKGSQRIRAAASGRQLRPTARPAITPRMTPLASMRVAHQGLTSEPATQLGEGLVVDRRQLADLERAGAALRQQLLEGPDDLRIELDALVLGQLLESLLMPDRLAINAI